MRLSGSKVGLALQCGWWAQDSVNLPPDEAGSAALIGTAFHTLAGARIEGLDIVDALELAKPDLERITLDERFAVIDRAERWWVESWPDAAPPADGTRVEVAYAYDPAAGTARELGTNIGREYAEAGAKPGDICCSVDVVNVSLDGTDAIIIDHKTGRGRPQHASESGQLWFAALCVLRCNPRLERIRIEYHYVDERGGIEAESHEILDPAFELAAFAAELREAAEAIASETAEPTPGMHCSELYCRARTICPAIVEQAGHVVPAEVASAIIPARALLARVESVEQLAQWLTIKPVLSSLLDDLDASAKEFAASQGESVDIGGGKAYRRCPTKGRRGLDTKAVRAEHGDKYDTTGKPGHSWKVVNA